MEDAYNMFRESTYTFYEPLMHLSQPSRDVICIMYLILRALDTFEDDPYYGDSLSRADHCDAFSKCMDDVTDMSLSFETSIHKYKSLMNNFGQVIVRELMQLNPMHIVIIRQTAAHMGRGMANMLRKHPTWIRSLADFYAYCEVVSSNIAVPVIHIIAEIYNIHVNNEKYVQEVLEVFAVILQTVNIVRDVRDDIIQQGRCYWPYQFYMEELEGVFENDEFSELPNPRILLAPYSDDQTKEKMLRVQNRLLMEAFNMMFDVAIKVNKMVYMDIKCKEDDDLSFNVKHRPDRDRRMMSLCTKMYIMQVYNLFVYIICDMYDNPNILKGSYIMNDEEIVKIKRMCREICYNDDVSQKVQSSTKIVLPYIKETYMSKVPKTSKTMYIFDKF